MLPDFNISGVLPPKDDKRYPRGFDTVSPYVVSIEEFAEKFAYSPERVSILTGFLQYREHLQRVGITEGFHWINGSFLEDIENSKLQRPPKDIDVIAFYKRPVLSASKWSEFLFSYPLLTERALIKQQLFCDTFLFDVHDISINTINKITYWYALFSHQRTTELWKGIVQIPLLFTADADVLNFLNAKAADYAAN